MYRRYYQEYNPSVQNPQRPIGQDQETEDQEGYEIPQNQLEDTETPNTGEPEIIVPEKPVHISETHTKLFSAFPLFNNKNNNIFANFGKDDLIILALIFIFLMDGVQDNLILLILVFIFFAGLST